MDREQMIEIGAEGIRARLSPMFNQLRTTTEQANADSVISALEAAGVVMVDRYFVLEAYDAGFNASGEGWNGEHPCGHAENPYYITRRGEDVDAMLAARPK